MNIYKSIQARIIQPWQRNNFEKTHYGQKIKQYKNKYKGERCFIVANGPSLSIEDLNILHNYDEITFAMNRIYKLFGRTLWRPTFYVCEDELIIRDHQNEINNIEAKTKFIPIELKWWHDINIKNACYFHLNYDEKERYPYSFSTDCSHQIDCRGTVTFTCMQLAAYMGFSEIYLLGVDHNYRVTIDIDGNIVTDLGQKDYFVDDYDKDIKNQVVHDMGNNTRAYLDALAYTNYTKGLFKIINATRGGKLEVFPRINFDSLFLEKE